MQWQQDRPVLSLQLRLRVLSFLPPNDLALAGRLSCPDAAQEFNLPHHRTAHLGQPLPSHAVTEGTWHVEGALVQMRELNFRQKLQLLVVAASSGCEHNVGFASQLLLSCCFPELLQSEEYRALLPGPVPDVGSAAVASGLAHLLPTLKHHYRALLDPVRTLEAAARHCDLAGLQAAWELLSGHIMTSLEQDVVRLFGFVDMDEWLDRVREVWRRMVGAAAASATQDAVAKAEWLMGRAHDANVQVVHADVCGAAAASGDLARVQWLQARGFPWGTPDVLLAVMQHAELAFIQQMEEEGGFLPPADHPAWRSEALVATTAAAAKDSAAKLQWLGEKGAALGGDRALHAAARCGNLGALQVVVAHRPAFGNIAPANNAVAALGQADPVQQAHANPAGPSPEQLACLAACQAGDPHTLMWLLQAGCPRGPLALTDVVQLWPSRTRRDGELLVVAVQLLAQTGWLVWDGEAMHPLEVALDAGHHWLVLWALRQLMPPDAAFGLPPAAAMRAAAVGCEATLETLVGLGVHVQLGAPLAVAWYAAAAENGDRGTSECLVRLGVPRVDGVLAAALREGAPLCALRWLAEQGAPVGNPENEVLGHLDEYYGEEEVEEVEAWLRALLLGPEGMPA